MNTQEIQKQEELKLQQQVLQLEAYVKQYLTGEAISRYGNIKSAHPEKAIQIITFIAQLAHNNQIKNKLSDQEFKQMLMYITQEKRTTRIIRK